jgi:hypothetical protein
MAVLHVLVFGAVKDVLERDALSTQKLVENGAHMLFLIVKN